MVASSITATAGYKDMISKVSKMLKKDIEGVEKSKNLKLVSFSNTPQGRLLWIEANLDSKSPYAGLEVNFELLVGIDYPLHSFCIRRITPKLFHPNFNIYGGYPLKEYCEPWNPNVTITETLEKVVALLTSPVLASEKVYNEDAALIYQTSPELYYKLVRNYSDISNVTDPVTNVWLQAKKYIADTFYEDNILHFEKKAGFYVTTAVLPKNDFVELKHHNFESKTDIANIVRTGKAEKGSTNSVAIVKSGDKFEVVYAATQFTLTGLRPRFLLANCLSKPTWREEWLVPYHNTPLNLSELYRVVGNEQKFWFSQPQSGGVRAPYWGISFRQIAELLVETKFLKPNNEKNHRWTRADVLPGAKDISVYDFVPKFIWPKTRNTGMGYSLLVNEKQPKLCKAIVSHAWMEGILEFFFTLQTVLYTREDDNAYDQGMFICFLAIYQNDGKDKSVSGPTIQDQIGTDILKSPFVEVLYNFVIDPTLRVTTYDRYLMQSAIEVKQSPEILELVKHFGSDTSLSKVTCGRMIAIPNKMCNIYTRMWCVLELFMSVALGTPTIVASNEEAFLDANIDLSKGTCGNPADAAMIKSAIERLGGFSDAANILQSFQVSGKTKR